MSATVANLATGARIFAAFPAIPDSLLGCFAASADGAVVCVLDASNAAASGDIPPDALAAAAVRAMVRGSALIASCGPVIDKGAAAGVAERAIPGCCVGPPPCPYVQSTVRACTGPPAGAPPPGVQSTVRGVTAVPGCGAAIARAAGCAALARSSSAVSTTPSSTGALFPAVQFGL